MRNRAFRPIAAILSLLLAAVVPAQASPVPFADIVQIVGNGHTGVQDLRLRSVSQSSSTPTANNANNTTSSAASSSAASDTPSSLIATAGAVQQGTSGGNVETIQTGDISGTICDCGEIAVPGGGFAFPKLALLGLGAIPFAFIHGGNDRTPFEQPPINQPPPPTMSPTPPPTTTPTPPPTTTPPPAPIPEPATLLLFGSGLAALSVGARRRRTRSKMVNQSASLTGEVSADV